MFKTVIALALVCSLSEARINNSPTKLDTILAQLEEPLQNLKADMGTRAANAKQNSGVKVAQAEVVPTPAM